MRSERTPSIRVIARNVQRLRTEMGWSQSALAKRAGLQPSRISELEGYVRPGVSTTTLDRLAEALGTSVSELAKAPEEE